VTTEPPPSDDPASSEATGLPPANLAPQVTTRRRPTLAKTGILFSCLFASVHLSLLCIVAYSAFNPQPGIRCGTGQIGALTLGALCISPVALALAAAHPFFRRQLPTQRNWRALAVANIVLLITAVAINWLVLVQLL
jgi:hypothetical protein